LKVPTRFNSSRSKGAWRRKARGISWFKSTALEHIGAIREIADILKRNGRPVELLKTRRPGVIVYEDDYQIVAEPFADTPR